MGITSVDPHALRVAALKLDAAADLLHAALSGRFGGGHVNSGALHAALDQLRADVGLWQHAARETAEALRIGADRYTNAEADAAVMLS